MKKFIYMLTILALTVLVVACGETEDAIPTPPTAQVAYTLESDLADDSVYETIAYEVAEYETTEYDYVELYEADAYEAAEYDPDELYETDIYEATEYNEADVYESSEPSSPDDAELPEIQTPLGDLTVATVQRVIDGDTIVLTTGERVRFIGVDAPEIGEPGADEATDFVRERVDGQTVWLSSSGADLDRFGRLRRYVWIAPPSDTQDIEQIRSYKLNALLLYYGLAEIALFGSPATWHYAVLPATATTSPTQPPAPVPPPPAPPPTPTPAPTPPSPPPAEEPVTAAFIGNRNSQIFHLPTCGTLPAPHNRVNFSTRDDAISAGHRPCQRCRP